MNKPSHVIKRSGAIVPFNKDRITNAIYRAAVSVGGRDRDRADFLAGQVVKILEKRCSEGHTPHIEEIQDIVEEVLIENGHAQVAKEYILYREEQARKRHEQAERASRPSGNIPWAKIWHILNWAVSHNLHTIDALNERIRRGEFPHIVHESEAAYEDDVRWAAEMIAQRSNKLKMVIISGPSSSGKTTTTIKLERHLARNGFKFVAFHVDNYFFDLEIHPKDEFGDYDFETPQALDLELISEHLQRLIQGEEVLIPYYDFKTGKRNLNQSPMKLEKKEILLIDSLHGLFPKMTKGIPDEVKFKLYLEPLLQMKGPDERYIRWTDLRLIRRMLRDSTHRAYDPQKTLEHWHYVRASELRYIIPHINTTDYIINSGMPYEIPLYRPKLLDQFAQWKEKYLDDPLREDASIRATRLHALLQAVEPMDDDSPIPSDSVLREFIGGSSLQY
ncbi:MAG: response regulator SirA [Chloroflexi bacterium RBG_16_48_8]|nr:MAG: response regulator SirA [Chloroflexi bacterium RBG_16_48_8]